MTDPRIVTDADTIARLAKKAKAIDRILGDCDKIVMVRDGDGPATAMVADVTSLDGDGSWTAVTIDDGHIWHCDGTDTVTGPAQPAPDPVGAHDDGHCLSDGGHFFDDGTCSCVAACCEGEGGDSWNRCICRWGCTDRNHSHSH